MTLGGQRRRPYLLGSALVVFLIELMMSILDIDMKTAQVLMLGIQVGSVFSNVVAEAILVEISQVDPTRNVSLFFGMRAFGGLIYTAIQQNMPIHRNSFQVLSIMPLLMLAISCITEIDNSTIHKQQSSQEIIRFIRQPEIYRPIMFIFFFMATPSPATSMFYFYVNQLRLNDDFFITLKYTYSLCSIMAVLIYYSLLRNIKFGNILATSNVLYVLASLLSLLLVTRINIGYNIPDYEFCMWDNIIMQTLQEINTMPVLVLACRMCPQSVEATIYSILMATINLANVLSHQAGIMLTFYLGITNSDFTNLWLLILVCNIVSQLPMPFIGAVNEEQVIIRRKTWCKDDLHKIL